MEAVPAVAAQTNDQRTVPRSTSAPKHVSSGEKRPRREAAW